MIVIFLTPILVAMSFQSFPNRVITCMAFLLLAGMFCSNADAALQLGLDEATAQCSPVEAPSSPEQELEQSHGDLSICDLDAGISSVTFHGIAPSAFAFDKDAGELVRRPRARIFGTHFPDPLDQVPRA